MLSRVAPDGGGALIGLVVGIGVNEEVWLLLRGVFNVGKDGDKGGVVVKLGVGV
jgi:hypothetical protein